MRLGGRVVKNVAGFDVAKAVLGGHGAYGVDRRGAPPAPRPPRGRRDAAWCGSLRGVALAGGRALAAGVAPAALEVLSPPLAHALLGADGWALVARDVGRIRGGQGELAAVARAAETDLRPVPVAPHADPWDAWRETVGGWPVAVRVGADPAGWLDAVALVEEHLGSPLGISVTVARGHDTRRRRGGDGRRDRRAARRRGPARLAGHPRARARRAARRGGSVGRPRPGGAPPRRGGPSRPRPERRLRRAGAGMTAVAFAGLDPCVHCGFCLPACPTYEATLDESDSPRGRIVLMRALQRGEAPSDDPSLTWHLDRCLGCRACESACPSGVSYGPAIEAARARIAEVRPNPPAVDAGLWLLARPARQRLAWWASRAARATGLPAALAKGAGGDAPVLVQMLAMLAATGPPGRPHRRTGAPAVAPGDSATPRPGRRERTRAARPRRDRRAVPRLRDGRSLRSRPPGDHPDAGGERRRHGGGAAPGLLRRARGARRPGRPRARAGPRERPRLRRRGAGAPIVTNSAGCGAALKAYGEWLADDPARGAGARLRRAGAGRERGARRARAGAARPAPPAASPTTPPAICTTRSTSPRSRSGSSRPSRGSTLVPARGRRPLLRERRSLLARRTRPLPRGPGTEAPRHRRRRAPTSSRPGTPAA